MCLFAVAGHCWVILSNRLLKKKMQLFIFYFFIFLFLLGAQNIQHTVNTKHKNNNKTAMIVTAIKK